MTITYCHNCEHLHPNSEKMNPWRWMCLKHPRREGFGYVTPDKWDDFPPYLFCRDLNGGACPLWEPRREHEDQ